MARLIKNPAPGLHPRIGILLGASERLHSRRRRCLRIQCNAAEGWSLRAVWMVTKRYLTKFLVIDQDLVLVWIRANYLASQNFTTNFSSLL